MTSGVTKQTVRMVDLHGKHIATAKLPKSMPRTGMIMWGNRYFAYDPLRKECREIFLYLVPLEDMWFHDEPAPALPFRKAER